MPIAIAFADLPAAAERLAAERRPVLTVGAAADGAIRRAVAAVDFGPASVRAAAIACRMLAPGGTLSLVHVKAGLEPDHPAWEAGPLLQRLAVALRNGTTGCDDVGASVARRDVTIGAATLVGEPAPELVDYAAIVGADLVAVGARGTGRVAADVARRAARRLPGCSVLWCRAPEVERVARELLAR